MYLFEVTNGFIGESYIRVYVWADSEEAALAFARQTYQDNAKNYGEHYWSNLHCRKLFSQTDSSFCTLPDDAGWETEKIQH